MSVDLWLYGKIGVSVPEDMIAWTSSNRVNDSVAVTIEVSSDSDDNAKMDDAAYESTIRLVADICDRHNIEPSFIDALKDGSVTYGNVDTHAEVGKDIGTITSHCFWANKSCPGNWFYAKLKSGEFIEAVKNEMKNPTKPTETNNNNVSNGTDDWVDIHFGEENMLAMAQMKLDMNVELTDAEKAIASQLQASIRQDIKTTDYIQKGFTIVGILVTLYGVLFLLGALFDTNNSIIPFEAVYLLSFHKLRIVGEDTYRVSNKMAIDNVRNITTKQAVFRAIVTIFVGIILLTGLLYIAVNDISTWLVVALSELL